MKRLKFASRLSLAILPCFLLAGFLAVTLQAQNAPPIPKVIHEPIEWYDIWIPTTDDKNLPRVILIGDSITRAYYPVVEAKLQGKAVVARLTTSSFVSDPALLAEIAMVLTNYHFDIIQFNNGMHGWDYTEDDYKQYFPQFVQTIRQYAPNAKLIWATTTPVRLAGHLDQFDPRTDRVRVRNQIAAAYLAGLGIPTDDLFTLVLNHPEYWRPDGVHYVPAGVNVEATQVAASIEKALKENH
ncbi:MAG TPA: SGNH/GDSL hydrolase family protein [Phycisphaerae bacterium]|nr:SGNH/GDSL hydrolase family protein [Phycisphaerae bacterium]